MRVRQVWPVEEFQSPNTEETRFQVLKARFQCFRLGFALGFLFKKIFQEVSSSKVGFHGATSGKFEGLVLKGVGRIVQGTGMREEL